jgi:hypothetical protein
MIVNAIQPPNEVGSCEPIVDFAPGIEGLARLVGLRWTALAGVAEVKVSPRRNDLRGLRCISGFSG